MAIKPIVIAGSGLAGYSVARDLRKVDTTTPLVIVTADAGQYYSKPQLSNALALGKDAATLAAARAEQMAERLNARILARRRVTAIDPRAKAVELGSESLPYFKLVLGIGADPVRAPIEGDGAIDVLSVNDIADYGLWRSTIRGCRRILVIGAGLIGCEMANDLRGAGYTVDVVDQGRWPLSRLVPEPAGRALRSGLAAAGVAWHLNNRVRSVAVEAGCYRIELADGSRLAADAMLSAVGLRPRVELAREAGLEVNRGIRVDRFLRTSAEAVYALGDCAEVEGQVLPFVLPIMHAARALARTLSGRLTAAVYPPMPIVVKTPAHPVVVARPNPGAPGRWRCARAGNGIRAEYRDHDGRLRGFALTGEAVAERPALARALPPVMA